MTNFKNSGKLKAVTFSFDDGIVQDYRMIELLNKYGLKATFNVSSGLWASPTCCGSLTSAFATIISMPIG